MLKPPTATTTKARYWWFDDSIIHGSVIHQFMCSIISLPFIFFVSHHRQRPILIFQSNACKKKWQNDIYSCDQNIVETVIAFDKDIYAIIASPLNINAKKIEKSVEKLPKILHHNCTCFQSHKNDKCSTYL